MTWKEQDAAPTESGSEVQAAESAVESWLLKAVAASAAPPPLPVAGQLIGGKYLVEDLLGRGGMGAVFRAVHVVSGKPVALKWMLRSTEDERARQRFTREARAAGRIDHPNVVDIYDIGDDGDAAFLVMELLRGESLRARLARGALTPMETVDILLPAMHGVAAAHSAGVIHRDLKPDNLFLCRGPAGEEREAKVLDFGISTIHAADGQTQKTLTQDGMVLGTLAYMSPEQLQNARDVDARSDVYAFGVIMYEALTGRTPYEATTYHALMLAILHGTPRKPSDLQPELPQALERIVLRALAHAPEQRFASVEALIAALLPFASSSALASSAPASAPTSPLAFARTHPSQPDVRSRGWSTAKLRVPRAPLLLGAIAVLAALGWWFGKLGLGLGVDARAAPVQRATEGRAPGVSPAAPRAIAAAVAAHPPAEPEPPAAQAASLQLEAATGPGATQNVPARPAAGSTAALPASPQLNTSVRSSADTEASADRRGPARRRQTARPNAQRLEAIERSPLDRATTPPRAGSITLDEL